MIIVDTSVWVDHFRVGDAVLSFMLEEERVAVHPFVLGEISLGFLRQREAVLDNLARLPRAALAEDHEVFGLIEQEKLFECGIGYIDAHLLASALLMKEGTVWKRDKRLQAAAQALSVEARLIS